MRQIKVRILDDNFEVKHRAQAGKVVDLDEDVARVAIAEGTVELYIPEAATSTPAAKPDEPAAGAGAAEPVNYEAAWNKDELLAEVEKRGLTVEGTGEGGRVLKADLAAALEADDANKEQ